MADPNQNTNSGGIDGISPGQVDPNLAGGNDESIHYTSPKPFTVGGHQVLVNKASINGRPIRLGSKELVSLKAGGVLTIGGGNCFGLGIYDRADFLYGETDAILKTGLNVSDAGDSARSFIIPDLNVGDAGFRIRLKSTRNQGVDWTFGNRLVYREEDEEEKKKKALDAEEEQLKNGTARFGLADIFGQAGKTAAGGTGAVAGDAGSAGATAKTIAQGKTAASPAKSKQAGKQQALEDFDSEEVTQEVSTTGNETISQSGTVTAQNSSEISSSGTVQQSSKVSGGGGTATSTISGTRDVASGGGTASQTVNVGGSSTTRGEANATQSSTINASASEKETKTAKASQETGVTAGAHISDELKVQAEQPAGVGGATVSASQTAFKTSKVSESSTANGSQFFSWGGTASGGGFNITSGTSSAPQMPMPKPPAGLKNLKIKDVERSALTGNLNISETGTEQQSASSNISQESSGRQKTNQPKQKDKQGKKEGSGEDGAELPLSSGPAGNEAGEPGRKGASSGTAPKTQSPADKSLAKPLKEVMPPSKRPNLHEGQQGNKLPQARQDDTPVDRPLGAGGLPGNKSDDKASEPKEKGAQAGAPNTSPASGNQEQSPEAKAQEASQLGEPLSQAQKPEEKESLKKDDDKEGGSDNQKEEGQEESQAPQRALAPVKAGGKAKVASQAEISEAQDAVNKFINSYLSGIAWSLWGSALFDFGLSILIGAVVGDLLWLLKDWLLERALRTNPLLSKFKSIGLENIKIKFGFQVKAHIVAFNLGVLAVIAAVLIIVITVLYGYCHYTLLYPVRLLTGTQSFCNSFNNSTVSNIASTILPSSGSYQPSYNVPGSLNGTATWTNQINSESKKYNLDACILRVTVQKESGGTANVIGCDCKAQGNPGYCKDSSKVYYPGYNFNWAQCSYGIGLTQWTIYQSTYANAQPSDTANYYKRWQDANTPSRTPFGAQFYTVTDFLDPNTSLDLTAQALSKDLAKASGDVATAFANYVGKSSQQSALVADRMSLYNLCQSNNVPATGTRLQ